MLSALTAMAWVDGFAVGVVRILIGFARIRSVCESIRIANQFAGEAVYVYSRAICTISRSIANPGRIRANPFSLRIVANCKSTTQRSAPPHPHTLSAWVDGFAFGVVRILIGFARIRSVCESVRIANPSRRRGSH